MNYSKNKLFLLISISIILGTYFWNLSKDYNILMIVGLFLLFLYFVLFLLKKVKLIYLICSFLAFLLFLGYSIYNVKENLYRVKYLEKITQNYTLSDKVEIKLLYKSKTTDYWEKYVGRLLTFWWQNVKEKINLNIYTPGEYWYSRWNIFSTKAKIWQLFEKYWNDYKFYNYSKWIYWDLYLYQFENLWLSKSNIIEDKINNLRESVLKIIFNLYPKEEWNLLWWILLWARENLSNDLKSNFNNSWLTHIIAVSWYNITIIIIFFWLIFSFLPPLVRFVLIVSIITFFTFLVWDSPAVIRASIMWGIWYFVVLLWRDNNLISTLLLSLVLMIVYQPLSLNYDISLKLSFLAVVWLIYLKPVFDKLLSFLWKSIFVESISLTLSATIFTLPIIICNFWYFSIVSPVTNLLIWASLPFAMLFWFMSILSIKLSIISYIFGYFAWLILNYIIGIINYFGSLEFSVVYFYIWKYNNIFSFLYFVWIIVLLLIFYKKNKEG